MKVILINTLLFGENCSYSDIGSTGVSTVSDDEEIVSNTKSLYLSDYMNTPETKPEMERYVCDIRSSNNFSIILSLSIIDFVLIILLVISINLIVILIRINSKFLS